MHIDVWAYIHMYICLHMCMREHAAFQGQRLGLHIAPGFGVADQLSKCLVPSFGRHTPRVQTNGREQRSRSRLLLSEKRGIRGSDLFQTKMRCWTLKYWGFSEPGAPHRNWPSQRGGWVGWRTGPRVILGQDRRAWSWVSDKWLHTRKSTCRKTSVHDVYSASSWNCLLELPSWVLRWRPLKSYHVLSPVLDLQWFGWPGLMERVDQWRFLIPCIEPSRIGSMGQEENQNQPRIWQKTFAACLVHTKVPYALCGDYKALRLESLHTWHPQIPKIKKNGCWHFTKKRSRIDPCIHKRPQMYAHTRRQIYIYIIYMI